MLTKIFLTSIMVDLLDLLIIKLIDLDNTSEVVKLILVVSFCSSATISIVCIFIAIWTMG